MSSKDFITRLTSNSRAMRAAATGLIVAVAVAGLWQAGILFRDPNETVERTGDSGETLVIDIRAADTSVETPGSETRSVGLDAGELAPDFEVSTLDGERVRLSDYRGQAVYLNFWASWCTPCRAEMPDIQALYDQHREDGLVVLAVNAGEAYNPAIGFVEELNLDLTAFGLDPSRDVVSAYSVRSMPTSVFIDRDGVITRLHAGFATAEQMQEFALEALGQEAAVHP